MFQWFVQFCAGWNVVDFAVKRNEHDQGGTFFTIYPQVVG